MTMAEDTPANQARAAGYIDPVRAVLPPAVEGYFGGKVDPARLSFFDSTVLQLRNGPQGDFRNWNKITSWAQSAYTQVCA
jgi:menaquinone-dependent protoporphyrinogen IX oxidase